MIKLAALFVQDGGCYFDHPLIDPWPITRDARNYAGPYPVIAHPPCQLWGALAFVNYMRWGGEHNRPGNDGGCFASAIRAVNTYGGVVEHPAKSRAFCAYGIPKPEGEGWKRVGLHEWVCEVWQSAYGHKANKATWLYYVGRTPPAELLWDRVRGRYQIGCENRQGFNRNNKPTLSKREANATPVKFRDVLINLAVNSNYVSDSLMPGEE